MPHLLTDPNDTKCPDYSLQYYDPMRVSLLNNNTSHTQAANILKAVWTAQNTIKKYIWQDQIDEVNTECLNLQVLKNAEAQKIADKMTKEKEEAQKEERKKNSAKFTPIPKRSIPSHTPIILAPSAIWNMELGQYVPLWYYTNAGLANQTMFDSTNEDVLTIITGPNGLTTAVQATNLQESKGLIEDHNLTFEQFQLAMLHMLTTMHQPAWPKGCIDMMETF